jgi:LuxR family transcriptional regulator, maltose regulon positive regulatory protein
MVTGWASVGEPDARDPMTAELTPTLLDLKDWPALGGHQPTEVPHSERRTALRDRRKRPPMLFGPVSDSGPLTVTWRSIIQGCSRELRERILASAAEDWSADASMLLALASSFRSTRATNPFAAIDYLDAADGLLDAMAVVHPALRVVSPILRSVTYRELGHFDDARHQLRLARDQLSSAKMPLQSRIELHAVILQHTGICQMLQGEFDGSRRNLLRGLRLAEACAPWCPRAEGYGCVALIDFLTGSVCSAEAKIKYSLASAPAGDDLVGLCVTPALLARVLIQIERGQLDGVVTSLGVMSASAEGTEYEPLIMYALATQRESLGEEDQAIEQLQELQLLIRGWAPNLAHQLHHLARISILTRRRETSGVRDLVAQLKPDPSHSICPAQVEARLELELGNFERALDLTGECLRLGDDHAPRTYGYASLINAASRVALGDLSTADAIFERSLAQAASRGLLRPFTSLPQPLLASLVSRAKLAPHPEASGLLEKIAAALPDEAPPPTRLLSPTETVVLGYLVAGESQVHISRLLSISPNTVKSHVRSIYRKLGVTSRSGAAQRARTLGIIG